MATKQTKAELLMIIREKNELIAGLRRQLGIALINRAAPKPFMIPPPVVQAYFAAHPGIGRSATPDVIRAWATATLSG